MKYLSVFNNDKEILVALSDIHLKGKWFDLDCTYSKGIFWKELKKPNFISDLNPIDNSIIKCDCRKITFLKEKINSIVFDPPFLFRNRKAENKDNMCKRFNYFVSYEELLNMYKDSLKEFNKILHKNGYVFFKCQDMTDGKFYCTHNDIINFSKEIGFELKDIVIKVNKSKLQADAKQQNCVAKIHTYWLVFKKRGDLNEML
jgi:hypothetical protein